MSTASVRYESNDPSTTVRNKLTVETDSDLCEAWLEVEGAGVCIDPQQAAQIARQLVNWIGDRAARA